MIANLQKMLEHIPSLMDFTGQLTFIRKKSPNVGIVSSSSSSSHSTFMDKHVGLQLNLKDSLGVNTNTPPIFFVL